MTRLRPKRFSLAAGLPAIARRAGVALAVPLLVAACASVVTQQLESVIRGALAQVIGPAMHYEVDVDGVSEAAGRLDRVRILGLRVARPDAPVFDRVRGDFTGVVIDRTRQRITTIGAANVSVELRSEDLAAYLMARGLFDAARVEFLPPAGIVASGRLKLAGLSLGSIGATEFRGRLSARGSQLRLSVDSRSAGTAAAPTLLRGLVEAAVN